MNGRGRRVCVRRWVRMRTVVILLLQLVQAGGSVFRSTIVSVRVDM